MPTGDPTCPPEVREAKRILIEIKKRADIESFDDDEMEDYNETGPDVLDVPDVIDGVSNEESRAGATVATRAPAPAPRVPAAVTPSRMQRISTPRQKKSTEDLSLSEFLKFSMMQREEDRKEREEERKSVTRGKKCVWRK